MDEDAAEEEDAALLRTAGRRRWVRRVAVAGAIECAVGAQLTAFVTEDTKNWNNTSKRTRQKY